jgi:hypothetical protein
MGRQRKKKAAARWHAERPEAFRQPDHGAGLRGRKYDVIADTKRKGRKMIDWRHIHAHKISNERPSDWPEGVRAISQRA